MVHDCPAPVRILLSTDPPGHRLAVRLTSNRSNAAASRAAGLQRSRSFQRLLADLKHFRRRYIPELVARRQLEQNHWILPEWIPALLVAARASNERIAEDDEAETEPELSSHITLRWNSESGPIVRLTLAELRGRFDLAADRYQLRCGRQLLATWLRQPTVAGSSSVEYRVDVEQVEVQARAPEVVLHLEDETEEIVATQSIQIWDPAEDVQAIQVGSPLGGSRQSWRTGSEVVVLVRRGYLPNQEPDEWFLTGYNTLFERRWLHYSAAPAEFRVQDADAQPAWEAVAVPTPTLGQRVTIQVVPEQEPLVLGERFSLEISTTKDVDVEWVVVNGRALHFDRDSRAQDQFDCMLTRRFPGVGSVSELNTMARGQSTVALSLSDAVGWRSSRSERRREVRGAWRK